VIPKSAFISSSYNPIYDLILSAHNCFFFISLEKPAYNIDKNPFGLDIYVTIFPITLALILSCLLHLTYEIGKPRGVKSKLFSSFI